MCDAEVVCVWWSFYMGGLCGLGLMALLLVPTVRRLGADRDRWREKCNNWAGRFGKLVWLAEAAGAKLPEHLLDETV